VPEGTGTDRPTGTGTDGCRERALTQEPPEAVRDSSDAQPDLQPGIST